MALIRIYLAEQAPPNRGAFEIYREGTPTGEMVKASKIRKLLSTDQYKDFVIGETIFMIPGETFRARNHKEKVTPKGRTVRNLKKKKKFNNLR